MNKQALRNLLRWGGLAVAVLGYVLGRTAHSISVAHAGRVLIWVGLGMIVAGIIVRLFVSEP